MNAADMEPENNANPQGESELRVFISSVMDGLMEYRRVAKKAIDDIPFARPWLFEDTPASTDSAIDLYLQKVAEAEITIWLIGASTTQPVVKEIHACLNAGKRLLAFKLPAESRDCETTKLLSEVEEHVKWREIKSAHELPIQIKAAIYDEATRAIRGWTAPTRSQKLLEVRRLSFARTKRMWTTLEVPDEIATELTDNQTVGDVFALPNTGLHVLLGDQGTGKSLAGERLLQKSIDLALEDASQPFPVFINARQFNEPLNEYVNRITGDVASPFIQGTFVVVDKIDELGITEANNLIDQLVVFADANSKSTIVAPLRPLPGLKQVGTRVDMPLLTDEQSLELIRKIAGEQVLPGVRLSSSGATWDATKRPLFAIMMGVELRQNPDEGVPSASDLVRRMAGRAFADSKLPTERVDDLLKTLAVQTTISGKPVPNSRISRNIREQHDLSNSRLVLEQDDAIDFTLAVFREWFAARAIVEGDVEFESLIPASDRWIIPISIATNADKEELCHSIMTESSSTDPGFGSLLLNEIDPGWYFSPKNVPSFGTAIEMGHQVYDAMEDWRSGLGNLFDIIGPIGRDGSTATVGVAIDQPRLITSWYLGNDETAKVVDLPSGEDRSKGWFNWQMRTLPRTRAWPWVVTKDRLVDSLSKLLDSRRLSTYTTDGIAEISWGLALELHQTSYSNITRLKISDTNALIDANPSGASFQGRWGTSIALSPSDIDLVRRHLAGLTADGNTHISDPWPSENRDVSAGSSWERYTEDQLLARTEEVYAAAVRIYEQMVNQWFAAFSDRLNLFQLLPVRMEGELAIPGNSDSGRAPRLSRRPRILRQSEQSITDFALAEQYSSIDDYRSYWDEELESFAMNRPGSTTTPTLFFSRSILEIFIPCPATDLAHEWLSDDLKKLGWIG